MQRKGRQRVPAPTAEEEGEGISLTITVCLAPCAKATGSVSLKCRGEFSRCFLYVVEGTKDGQKLLQQRSSKSGPGGISVSFYVHLFGDTN